MSKNFKAHILQKPGEGSAPTKPSFKQQQLRHRERALVTAAGHLFAEKGYERTTIDDVIGVVGISKPTFYSHFPSKETLAVKVIVSGLEKAFSQVEQLAATMPPDEAARAMIDWAIDNQSGPNGEPTFSGALAFFDHEEVLAAETKLTERLAELINSGQQEGTIEKVVDARILSRTFRSILKDNSFFDGASDSEAEFSAIKSSLQLLLLG
jgi:AcrR family transcriptional regulator